MKQVIKEGDLLRISAQERLYKSVSLIIGDDITIEDAEYFVELLEQSEEISMDNNGYDELQEVLNDDTILSSDGYENIDFELIQRIEEEDVDR